MTRKDLLDQMAQRAEITLASAEKALKAFEMAVAEALKDGDKVNVARFGLFSTSLRKERTWKNPKYGTTVSIPPTKIPQFKAFRGLRESLNKKA